jgi:Mrp family chromosome partitioning ATPase
MKPAAQLTARILQRWPIVVALAVVGGLVAAAWSITSAATVWTATTALTTQSQNRSPDQDAVLALGYVDYFNQATYQQLLRTEADIPAGVTLTAKTGATSPVFYVTASGPSEEVVRTASTAAAARYREDVRTSLIVERQQAATDLQAQIDGNVRVLQDPIRTDAERNVILDQIRSLQGRLTEIQADNTNLVKQLQPVPGVSSSTPSPATDIAAGVVGGALLGILAAILLGALDTRVRTARDLQQRLGLGTLADFAPRTDESTRSRRLANLANSLNLGTPVGTGADASRSGSGRVVAVVAARRTARSVVLARELVGLLAARRTESVLVLTDVATSPDRSLAGRSGLVEVLADQAQLSQKILRHPAGYDVLPTGQPPFADSFAAFPPGRLAEVARTLAGAYEVVVIDVPAVLDASESQLICALADSVLVAVERGRTRTADLREALRLLADVQAPVAGAVIDAPCDGAPPPTFGAVGKANETPGEPRGSQRMSGADSGARVNGNGNESANGGSRPSPHPRPSAHSRAVLLNERAE